MSYFIRQLATAALLLGCVTFATAQQINITFVDGAGEGFNDPTYGAQRIAAFEYAVQLWEQQLALTANIEVEANFNPMGGDMTSAILGFGSPEYAVQNFSGAPQTGTLYVGAEANQLHGSDVQPGNIEISITFNSDVDNPTVLGTVDWYYGTDAMPGSDIDFVRTALHELGHGLGFLSLMDGNGEFFGSPDIFSRQLRQGATIAGTDLVTMTNAQRALAITSDDLYWKGQAVIEENGNQAAKMYAPGTFAAGASISHWDPAEEITGAQNLLMEPFELGGAHTIDLMRQAFEDIGWPLAPYPPLNGAKRWMDLE